MRADELDYVVGVDTHLDEHVLVVVAALSGAVLARRAVRAKGRGYAAALRFAREAAGGVRVWAVEGRGSYGAGLARYLAGSGETGLEIGRMPRAERRLRGRTTRSTRPGSRGQHWPARRSPCRGRGSGGRPCGCAWSRVAAPSRCAAKRSGSCAV